MAGVWRSRQCSNGIRALIGCSAPFHVPVHTVVGNLPEAQPPVQRLRAVVFFDGDSDRLAGSMRLRAHPFHERGVEAMATPLRSRGISMTRSVASE